MMGYNNYRMVQQITNDLLLEMLNDYSKYSGPEQISRRKGSSKR